MKKNIWTRLIVIFAIITLCVLVVYPPSERIRLGKDLQGGTSIVLQVRIDDDDNWEAIIAQVITVIKERINPSGLLDISVQAQGRDRIEIVMPLPGDDVLEARAKYEGLIDEIIATARIPSVELSAALRANNAPQRFAGDATTGSRVDLLNQLQNTYNDLQAARAALAAVEGQEIDAVELGRLQQSVADKEYALDLLMEQTLRMSLDQRRLVQAVTRPSTPEPVLDDKGERVVDPVTGQPQWAPSARDVEVGRLKSEFPNLASKIDELVMSYDAYVSKRKGLDDPEDLLRLLRGAGVLDFHIAVRPGSAVGVNVDQLRQQLVERGPTGVDSATAHWFPINDVKQWYDRPEMLASLQADPVAYFAGRGLAGAEYDGRYYLLLYTSELKSITHRPGVEWQVERTYRTVDGFGRPAIAFQLDDAGGALMSRMTGRHVGEPMAIVLDGEVYTAPNLQSQIGKNGVIEGSFSEDELSYLTRVLAAGSLEARLSSEPIAVNTLGPSLGRDNLIRGLEACVLSLIVTAIIMLGYYFFAGAVANIALLVNTMLIFGVMAMVDGTFTLPGLAGIALSIAMAVDANVLIYERIREELVNNKEDLRTAIRLGYQRAMSAIIDGNLTNLIVCVVLLYTATTEVKGFAYTMIIGTLATLFSALYVTRTIYMIYTDVLQARKLSMLPIVFPAIHRALEPSINWIGKRHIFIVISIVGSIASLSLFFSRGSNMLDTEFRGGTSLTMQTARLDAEDTSPDAERLKLSLAEVRNVLHAIGDQASAADASGSDDPNRQRVLAEFANATVLTVGRAEVKDDDILASDFQIKVANPSGLDNETLISSIVVDAVVDAFAGKLDVAPPVTFEGADTNQYGTHTFPITEPELGKNINMPAYTEQVTDFLGGVAVVVRDMSVPLTLHDIERRIERIRGQPDFRDCLGRRVQAIGLDQVGGSGASATYRTVVVLVADEAFNYMAGDPDRWDQRLAQREWTLVTEAMQRPPGLQNVSSFSAGVARTLAANAIVAIVMSLLGMLVYIWVRFGSLRYSLSAIIALGHNVTICLGALALTHMLAGTAIANALMLDEFRIDLNVIAALLTIIGYSLNDTIVILDRIRENRGKRLIASAEVINKSINQTFSRTVLTGGSTVLASIILYVLGGPGIQPFAFTFLVGLLVGTYSSVAIAAPLVHSKRGSDEPVNAESDVESVFDPENPDAAAAV